MRSFIALYGAAVRVAITAVIGRTYTGAALNGDQIFLGVLAGGTDETKTCWILGHTHRREGRFFLITNNAVAAFRILNLLGTRQPKV